MRKIISFSMFFLFWGVQGWSQEPFSSSAGQNGNLAETEAQFDRIRTDLQELHGGLETQTVLMKQLETKSDRNYRDMELRLQSLEAQIKLFQGALDQALAKVSPAAAQEFNKFQNGLTLVQNSEYAKALPAFQQFLQQYPKSPHKPSALFWIAECRYALGDFAQAIKDYQKYVLAYPKSDKTPMAVLKQGDGFLRLNMPTEAKVFFKKVVQDYPNSEEASQARGKLAALEKGVETAAPLPPPVVSPTPSPTPVAPSPAPTPLSPAESSEF